MQQQIATTDAKHADALNAPAQASCPEKQGVNGSERIVWEMGRDLRKQLGPLLRKNMGKLTEHLSTVMGVIDDEEGLCLVLTETVGLDTGANQVANLLREHRDQISQSTQKEPEKTVDPDQYPWKLDQLLKVDTKLKFGYIPKGSDRPAFQEAKKEAEAQNDVHRGYKRVRFVDVNQTDTDHHAPGDDPTKCASDLVFERAAEIFSERNERRALIAHKIPDADSVVSSSLYMMIRNGIVDADNEAVQKLVRYTNSVDLGRWQEVPQGVPGLSTVIVVMLNPRLEGEDREIYRIAYEVVSRILEKNLDPAHLQSQDFRDIRFHFGPKKKIACIGDLIDAYNKWHEGELSKFHETQASKTYELDGNGFLIHTFTPSAKKKSRSAFSNAELYSMGYHVVFGPHCIYFHPDWASQQRTQELFVALEREETLLRAQEASQNTELDNDEYLRRGAVRQGYDTYTPQAGANANPWSHGAGFQFLVAPQGGSVIPLEQFQEIVFSSLHAKPVSVDTAKQQEEFEYPEVLRPVLEEIGITELQLRLAMTQEFIHEDADLAKRIAEWKARIPELEEQEDFVLWNLVAQGQLTDEEVEKLCLKLFAENGNGG